jgi:hypothetical protein
VQVLSGEREQDLKGGGRKRIEFSFGHGRSIINISKNDYTPKEACRQELKKKPHPPACRGQAKTEDGAPGDGTTS